MPILIAKRACDFWQSPIATELRQQSRVNVKSSRPGSLRERCAFLRFIECCNVPEQGTASPHPFFAGSFAVASYGGFFSEVCLRQLVLTRKTEMVFHCERPSPFVLYCRRHLSEWCSAPYPATTKPVVDPALRLRDFSGLCAFAVILFAFFCFLSERCIYRIHQVACKL